MAFYYSIKIILCFSVFYVKILACAYTNFKSDDCPEKFHFSLIAQSSLWSLLICHRRNLVDGTQGRQLVGSGAHFHNKYLCDVPMSGSTLWSSVLKFHVSCYRKSRPSSSASIGTRNGRARRSRSGEWYRKILRGVIYRGCSAARRSETLRCRRLCILQLRRRCISRMAFLILCLCHM